jgi:hypothetical protein
MGDGSVGLPILVVRQQTHPPFLKKKHLVGGLNREPVSSKQLFQQTKVSSKHGFKKTFGIQSFQQTAFQQTKVSGKLRNT